MISRRTFIAGTATMGAVGVVAACAPQTAAGGRGGTVGSAGPGVTLVALADVPVGGSVAVTTPSGDPVIVSQPTAGTAAAFSAVCTHQGCLVTPRGADLVCPCHGSVFDAKTGAVLQSPATRPLPSVPVTVQNGEVVTS
jgi:Rieske Fe-S protein